MNVIAPHVTSCGPSDCRIGMGIPDGAIRFAVMALTMLGAVLSAYNDANADEGQSAISQWIREEFVNIEQQLEGDKAEAQELSNWKKSIREILRLWAERQYQDAIRLSANAVPPAAGNDSSSSQGRNQFMILLRGALMYEGGDSAAAEMQLQRLLSDNLPTPSSNLRTEPIARRLLAKVMVDRAKFEAALAELDQALRITIDSDSETDPDMLAIMIDRVRVLTYLGRLVEARQLSDEIGPDVKRLEEEVPTAYADYLAVYGYLAFEEGEYSEAVDLMTSAAERHLRTYGPASRDSIEVLINLGLAEAAAQRPNDAERHLRAAMDGIEKTFGKQTAFHSRALQALGNLSITTNNFREAHGYATEASKVYSLHSVYDAAAISETFAGSLFFAQDPEPSRKCFREAAVRYAESGAKLRSIWARCSLARSHYQRAEYDQALTIWGPMMLEVERAKLIAVDHPRYLNEMYYMACSLIRLRQFEYAERLLTALMETGVAKDRFTDSETVWILMELGICQVKLQKYEAAEASLERALELINDEDTAATNQRAFTTAYLAECHIASGHFDFRTRELA